MRFMKSRLRRSIPAILVASAVVFSFSGARGQGPPRRAYKTGVLAPTEREKAWAKEHCTILRPTGGPAAAALPTSVKNIQYLPSVGLQYYGACAAWAIVYYQKSYVEAKEHGWVRPNPAVTPERVMSPAFSYNLLNGGDDSGSSIGGNYEVLTKWGAATCRTMDPNWQYLLWPDEPQWRDAHAQRIQSYSSLNVNSPAALTELKTQLAAGNIGVFVMVLQNNFVTYPATNPGVRDNVLFRSDGGVYIPGGTMTASHALTVIGYDDNRTYRDDEGVWHSGALLVVNSWGQDWGWLDPNVGTKGFIWIGYDCFMSQTEHVVTFMEDRTDYHPTDFAVIDLSHGRMSEVGAEIKGGDFDYPLWTFSDCFPRTGGVRPMNARVVLDLTDYATTPTYSYWFTIHDLDIPELWRPSVTGMVNDLRVEKPGYPPWVSTDTPHETIEMQTDPVFVPPLSLNVGIAHTKGAVFEGFEMGDGDGAWGDIDRDGDPDFVCQGWDYDEQIYLSRVYRNNGNGSFSNMDAGLPGLSGSLALGDYNNDGFLDVALSGYNGDWMGPVSNWTKVYRNENGAVFTDSGISLFCPPERSCQVAWVDYDDDGRLDLAVYDPGQNYPAIDGVLYFYKNNGSGGLTQNLTLNALPKSGRMAWADYDRDGLQDVAVSGGLDGGGFTYYETLLYRNQFGSFSAPMHLPGSPDPVLAWGDYNNDGWLDLGTHNGTGITVLRNNSGASFTDLNLNLGPTRLMYSRMEWGDIDGNGFADILVNGDHLVNLVGDVEKSSRVYANQGNGTFVNMGLDMPGVTKGGMFAADYDGDGDLDICVCGQGEKLLPPLPPYPLPAISRVFDNQTGGYTTYHAPSPPTGLVAESPMPDVVALKWDPASDPDTAAPGLFYNVRAGRNPYSDDYLSGASGIPARGSIVRPTLSPTQLGTYLFPAPTGPFFWSVQTIDPGLQASAWSKPCLVAPPGVIVGDVNQDGTLGVGDLVKTVRMSKNLETPDLARADRNGDGRVDTIDVLFMRRLLLLADAPDPGMIAAQRIGPEGGVLQGSGFKLTVPAGSFQEPQDLTLHQSNGDRPFGADSISPTYSLLGMPANFAQDLQLELQSDIAPGGASVLAMIADTTFVRSFQQPVWTHEMVPSTSLGGGKYQISVPASTEYVYSQAASGPSSNAAAETPDLAIGAAPLAVFASPQSTAAFSSPAAVSSDGSENLWRIGLSKFAGVRASSVGSQSQQPADKDDGGHFIVYFSDTADTDGIDRLATALEEAYNLFSGTYGFSYANRTRWPVTVTVLKLAPTVYGYSASSVLGDNYGYMEFNEDHLGAADEVAMHTTAGHEFFHLVQALYDPRNRISKAKFQARHLWLDEAMSTWSEGLFLNPPDPDYTPPFFRDNRFDLFFEGMHAEGTLAGPHGYGLSCVVKHLVDRQGTGFPLAVYNDIKADYHPVEAVCRNSPDVDPRNWYTDFVSKLIEGDNYLFTTGDIAALTPTSTKKWVVQDQFNVEHTRWFFGQNIPDLGASLFMATPQGASIPSDASFCAAILSADAPVSCNALYYKADPDTRIHLGFGQYMSNPWGYHTTKIEVDGFAQVASNVGNILLNVVNDRKKAPYTDPQTVGVMMGLAYDRTIVLTPATLTGAISFYYQFPSFTDSGTLQGKGILDLRDYGAAGLHFVWGTVVGANTRTFNLNYAVSPVDTVLTVPKGGGDLEEVTFLGVDNYRLSVGDEDHVDDPVVIGNSPTGTFQFDVEPQHEWVSAYVEVFFTASRRYFTHATGTWSASETRSEDFNALLILLDL